MDPLLKMAATNEFVTFADEAEGFVESLPLVTRGLVRRVADDPSGRMRVQITEAGLRAYRFDNRRGRMASINGGTVG